MIASDFKDSDGFKLQFDENCTETDKKYFMGLFPKVDKIKEDRVHCTTCDGHIGTAPISEKIVRTHQILGVTQCNKCFAFYNSGEFGKGEDGSEYYCRWCGQGGEVFCCSSCPFVFCNKCIRGNLSSSYVKEIEDTDDWSCFVCDKNILKKQRAQHWALRNFMNKQLEKIQKIHVNSEEELNNLLNEDISLCCPKKKRKSLVKPAPAPVKRPSMNGGSIINQPPAKRPSFHAQAQKSVKIPIVNTYRPTLQQAKPSGSGRGKNNDEIVCTPDILGLFNDNEDNSIPNSNMMPSTAPPPPPLVMRTTPRGPRPAGPTTVAAPIYHNVSGFQIDLNHAARQEIFRLPNGKLIQVRKQTGPPAPPSFRPGASISAPRGPQFTIRQAGPMNPAAPRAFRAPAAQSMRPRTNTTPQTRFTFSDGRVIATPHPPAPSTPAQIASTVFTQQNGSISVARAPQPNTPFGTAKTEFEDKIISGMEICQHTINKMITLTNSTSFKTSRTFKDLKDLYIHLQYLFTYTSGKFKTLQESLTSGMESLAKHEPVLKDKGDDDELEIVETKTDVIEVMSDDDEPAAAEKLPTPVKKTLLKHIQYTKEDSETQESRCENGNKGASTPSLEALLLKTDEKTPLNDELTPEEAALNAKLIESDKKLRNHVMVKIEKIEESEDVIVQHYLNQIKLREEASSPAGSSCDSSPGPFMLESLATLDEVEREKASSEEGDVIAIIIPDEEAAKLPSDGSVEKFNDKEDDDDDVILIPEDEPPEETVDTESSEKAESSKAENQPPVDSMEVDEEVEKTTDVDEEVEKTTDVDEEAEKTSDVDEEAEKTSDVDGEADKELAADEEDTLDSTEVVKEDEAEKSPDAKNSSDVIPIDEEENDKSIEIIVPDSENLSEQVNGSNDNEIVKQTEEAPPKSSETEQEKTEEENTSKELTAEEIVPPVSETADLDELMLPAAIDVKENGDQDVITAIADNEKDLFDDLFSELEQKSAMEVD